MKQLLNHKLVNRYSVGAVILLVIILAACAVLLLRHTANTEAASAPKADPQLAQRTPGNPQFSFSPAAATGWHQGPTDKVSMALFGPNGCFTSVQHKTGTVDVAAELKKDEAMLISMGYARADRGTLSMTLKTSAGDKPYQLYQYSASGSPGGRAIKGGQALGYVQLADGYVKVEGYCDTFDGLSSTTPALQAIRFQAD